MAVEEVSSLAITNRDVKPRIFNNSSFEGGEVQNSVGVVTIPALASATSKFRMCTVPSSARIKQLLLSCVDMGDTGDTDIGIYRTTSDGGAVVSVDHFADALDINAAALENEDVTHLNDYPLADAEKPLWEALGLEEDPCFLYDIVLTLSEAVTTGGVAKLSCDYVE